MPHQMKRRNDLFPTQIFSRESSPHIAFDLQDDEIEFICESHQPGYFCLTPVFIYTGKGEVFSRKVSYLDRGRAQHKIVSRYVTVCDLAYHLSWVCTDEDTLMNHKLPTHEGFLTENLCLPLCNSRIIGDKTDILRVVKPLIADLHIPLCADHTSRAADNYLDTIRMLIMHLAVNNILTWSSPFLPQVTEDEDTEEQSKLIPWTNPVITIPNLFRIEPLYYPKSHHGRVHV